MLYHFRTKSRLNVNHFVCTFAFTGKEAALPPPSNDLLCCCCFSIDTHTPPRVPRSGNNVTSNERFTPQSWCVNFQRVHYCLRTNESLPITKATLSLSDWRLYPRTNQFPPQMHKIVCFFAEITTRCNTFHTAVHPKRSITNHTAVAGLLFLSISSNEPKQKFSFPFQQQVVVATFGKPKKTSRNLASRYHFVFFSLYCITFFSS